jgi:hypothetical protein
MGRRWTFKERRRRCVHQPAKPRGLGAWRRRAVGGSVSLRAASAGCRASHTARDGQMPQQRVPLAPALPAYFRSRCAAASTQAGALMMPTLRINSIREVHLPRRYLSSTFPPTSAPPTPAYSHPVHPTSSNYFFKSNPLSLPTHPKCLPKPLKRSPLPLVRLLPERPQRRRLVCALASFLLFSSRSSHVFRSRFHNNC